MVMCSDMDPESDEIFKFLFNKIVDYLSSFLNIHPSKEIKDLLDNLLDFIPVYDVVGLEILSPKERPYILHKNQDK